METDVTVILCMYSGGLDSTGALYSLLTKPEYNDHDIHVHNMELTNVENRSGAEYLAVMNCRKWFTKNCRPFDFTRSSHNYSFMGNSFIWDADYVLFMASQITRCGIRNYTHICFGATKTDIDNPIFNQGTRMERAYAIRDAVYIGTSKSIPEKLYTVGEMTKQEIWDMLPEDLRKHTWSCRTPKKDDKSNWIACGQCITCEEMKNIG